MKFKYFLRGLGVGIIFASIICLTTYQENSSNEMTDAEIIERAKELGMVEEESAVGALMKEKETLESTTESQSTQADASEETTTAEVTEETAEQNTSEGDTPENQQAQIEVVEITVAGGSTSYTVCQKLQELGMIENADNFDDYLIENGYASRIRVGTHALIKGMDYKAIAEAISDPL